MCKVSNFFALFSVRSIFGVGGRTNLNRDRYMDSDMEKGKQTVLHFGGFSISAREKVKEGLKLNLICRNASRTL